MAKKILIADDDRALVEIIQCALEVKGLESVAAFDGHETLAKALSEKPDLILLDIIMPGLEGYQVFEKLQSNPQLKHIPVFVISGRKNMAELFPSKLITFVAKPFDVGLLVSQIGQTLERQALEESKDVLVFGVQEFVINKVKEWFLANHYKVTVPLNEYDAIEKCEMLGPQILPLPIWEDPSVLDSAAVYRKVKYGSAAGKVRFFIYCQRDLLIEAHKYFPPSLVLPFLDSRELVETIKSHLVA